MKQCVQRWWGPRRKRKQIKQIGSVYVYACLRVSCYHYLVAKFCLTFVTPRTVALDCRALLSMGFPTQEHWSGLPVFLQEILPTQGLNPHVLHWQMDSLPLSHQGSHHIYIYMCVCVCVCMNKYVCVHICIWAYMHVCVWMFNVYMYECIYICVCNVCWNVFQQYVNRELPDVQAGFRKGRGTRDQIANIHWIIKNAREFQKNIYFCFIDYAKAFDCVHHNKLWKILQEMGIPDHLTCLLRNL